MLKAALIVGLGGFLGSIARFLTTQFLQRYFVTFFPVGTLVVNLLGCLLIGILFGFFEKGNLLSPQLRLFLTVGFCGGFTTFSAFAIDSVNLINDSEILYLMLYTGFSILAGIAFTFLGKNMVSYFWN